MRQIERERERDSEREREREFCTLQDNLELCKLSSKVFFFGEALQLDSPVQAS